VAKIADLIVKRYICAKGDVCSICSLVTIHFVTYIYIHHTEIRPYHNADSFIMNLRKNDTGNAVTSAARRDGNFSYKFTVV
jgi:hypothetical protein